ncbi:MAG: hypothetical protein O3C21_09780 [Verrucomicrobia bacterium]|nr:hypothetical protein [Verrucomicrobiota bacterium]
MPSPKSSRKKSATRKAVSPHKKKAAAKKGDARISAQTGTIEIRGVWQNNLKGIDLDLPLNQSIDRSGARKEKRRFWRQWLAA